MAEQEQEEITVWINRLADGDPQAAEVIWRNYFSRLVSFARRKMQDFPRRSVDEEDVAVSAMFSFYQGMELGKFADIGDRDDLWKLLVTITARKVMAHRTSSRRAKRGGGRVRGESVFGNPDTGQGEQEGAFGIGQVLGSEPTPEFAATVAENTRCLLDSLEDDIARQIAVMKLEGYNNREIAEKLGCARRTVERKLERLRQQWSQQGPE